MTIEITTLKSVPAPAKGLVRDIRVRWALEEAGLPYSVRPLDMRTDLRAHRPAEYLAQNPFGQIPVYRDDEVTMFETGAIVLHIGESSEALLPRDPQGRARATSWLLAALNTIEPATWNYAMLRVFYGGQDWAEQARPIFEETARRRLEPVAAYLGDKDWLEGDFTAGDLMMVSVLKVAGRSGLLDAYPTLAAYQARGEARPAYQRALAAQLADFEDQPAVA
ncbi:MAG: glutathione S-transferase family protein [Porphyrobacter sp.]|nr:glutathione S-transferase family protein [Porphyrobacter sp.]